MDMKTFVKERDMALISFVVYGRKDKLEKYAQKYDIDFPKDSNLLMAGACKALLKSKSAYINQAHRNKAIARLLVYGFKPLIGWP